MKRKSYDTVTEAMADLKELGYTIDFSGIDCGDGDEVLVFGELHTAEEFSGPINSISYELITAISQRIKIFVYY